ncbi:MAG TPA: nonribosomal peptide synthetase MxaA [Tardiphaga sp.]
MIGLPRLRPVVLALTVLLVRPTEAGLHGLRMEEPRNFGYFVGDTIVRHAVLLADADDTLLSASIPTPGPITYWLDLVRADVQERPAGGGRLYRITLVYQNFYVPLDSRKLTIPEWPLRLAASTAVIPAFTFTASPIRELFPEKSGETVGTFLRPDATPSPISAGWLPSWLGLCAVMTLLILTLLARHHAWWPFRRRPDRPFTQAARVIARVHDDGVGAVGYREALLALHRAFDAAARRRVLAADVAGFVAQHPEFGACRAAVEEFFQTSRQVFFSGHAADASALMPLPAVKRLAGELANRERTR